MRSWRLGATMFTIFGLLALLVAAIGLYSVVAYDVSQRTRELGVRVALGASAGAVLRLVVGEGLRVVVVGLVLGAAVALSLAARVSPLLYNVSPKDPVTYAGVVGVLIVVAVVASLAPALRASRVDPNVALRAD
jgi:ABC-type antimicrobial peptide transport system permease subunit